MEMNPMLQIAFNAAKEAGRAVMKVYESEDFEVEQKADQSPLTRADRAAHEVIMTHLEHTGIPVLSEEGRHMSFDERRDWESLWIVDPVDGTKEFIKRNGEFTVNIALVTEGRVVLGVVLAPVLKCAYLGVVGEGAWKFELPDASQEVGNERWEEPMTLPIPRHSGRPFTVVASRSHMSPETQAFVDQKRQSHGEVHLISKGSSLKLCMVAEGVADAYPRFAPTMEWDTAAGQAVCEAAGCAVIDQNTGNPMRYNREELLNAWFLVSRDETFGS